MGNLLPEVIGKITLPEPKVKHHSPRCKECNYTFIPIGENICFECIERRENDYETQMQLNWERSH